MSNREPSPGEASAPRKPRAARRHAGPVAQLLIKLALIGGVLAALFLFVMGVHIQQGNRMYPFLMDGDVAVTYKLDRYRVGDVVAYRNPDTGEKALSRIVALGENILTITGPDGLLINGASPVESVFYPTAPAEGSRISFPYTMQETGVFVLDDYRTIGVDSRTFGELKESDLLGKVVYVFRRRGI